MDDWFRNETWSPEIAKQFEAKLRRSRKKSQYLCLQAGALADTHPEVALELSDRYLQLPVSIDLAQAFVDRARAKVALGDVGGACAEYRAALEREAEFPHLLTNAYTDYPLLIASRGVAARFDEALEILDSTASRMVFPADQFKWHAARALIFAEQGLEDRARADAEVALDAARTEHSGLPQHPEVGLVGERYEDLRHRLQTLRNS